MPAIVETAPAKINLSLKIAGRRSDGFHELQSLVAFARNAADIVTLETDVAMGSSPSVSVTGPFAATIAGQNLLALTLQKVSAAAPEAILGRVTLEKNLPVAAGIGGGSADAAALLRAIRTANPKLADMIDWQGLALRLGADVPVCLANRPAWMTGVGEKLTELGGLPPLNAVLVNPCLPMPEDKTAQVFRLLGAETLDATYQPPAPPSFADAESLLDWMRATGNDLERPARQVAPIIAEVKQALSNASGCAYAALSGGGPTCFGVFTSASAADAAAASIARTEPHWWVQATTLA